jgi:hypothetical protein
MDEAGSKHPVVFIAPVNCIGIENPFLKNRFIVPGIETGKHRNNYNNKRNAHEVGLKI